LGVWSFGGGKGERVSYWEEGWGSIEYWGAGEDGKERKGEWEKRRRRWENRRE
jgi:hypothetical protein